MDATGHVFRQCFLHGAGTRVLGVLRFNGFNLFATQQGENAQVP